jgi:phospholipase D1/2
MPASRTTWIPLVATGVVLLLLAAAWRWTALGEWLDVDALARAVEPWRTSWFALPLTVVVFVIAELLVFPVLLLVFACGIVFGPWLGAVHALVGSLASALIPFAIGRRLGRDAVASRGGKLALHIERILERKGVIAVFLVRKIPAPYTLVNIVCGASSVSWLEFVVGTFLGMGTGVILITVLGGQLFELARGADPVHIGLAIAMLLAPLALALAAQRLFNRYRRAER